MATYRIGDLTIAKDHPDFFAALASAYARKVRPMCLCKTSGIAMYITRIGEQLWIKRMPNTGASHSPECPSYECPPHLSGKGPLIGTAIKDDPESGTIILRLDCPLTKIGTRTRNNEQCNETAQTHVSESKLSLRSLLHYLWEEAGLNRWTPAMQSKRHWGAVRKYLRLGAQQKEIRGRALPTLLFVPEPFSTERKLEIAQRRLALFSHLIPPASERRRRLMLMIGEVKELHPSPFDCKVFIKHIPDQAFLMSTALARNVQRHYEPEIGTWRAQSASHLMSIATLSVNTTGVAVIEAMGLMLVNERWIPIESIAEKNLVDRLIAEQRKFIKGMRYNLDTSAAIANILLTDTAPPTALFIRPLHDNAADDASLADILTKSGVRAWRWDPGASDMPPLPRPTA